MKYVFDNNTLKSILDHYFPERFPSFWEKFNRLKESGEIVSVREVRREIEELKRGDVLEQWMTNNREFFLNPANEELIFITEIFKVRHFQQNMKIVKQLKGGAYADPFIIAKAKVNNAAVVTQEKFKKNAAKIPNICKHFGIDCVDLENFLIRENWKF